jgi:GMP synthase PP-ATPase subunit
MEWISSVVVALLIKAIAHRLVCVHVNHGLFQKGEQKNDIKAHHNAGGLPEYMNFELVKPL